MKRVFILFILCSLNTLALSQVWGWDNSKSTLYGLYSETGDPSMHPGASEEKDCVAFKIVKKFDGIEFRVKHWSGMPTIKKGKNYEMIITSPHDDIPANFLSEEVDDKTGEVIFRLTNQEAADTFSNVVRSSLVNEEIIEFRLVKNNKVLYLLHLEATNGWRRIVDDIM